MTTYSASDKDPKNSTHYYCNCCNNKKYDYPERHRKWDKKPCLACGKLLPKGVQGGVIDSGYTGNLMVLLHNNLEKPYIIESKEKIAQTIFLLLVKIGKFVLVKNHKELLQTTKGTFDFGLTGKRIKVNFAETIEEKDEVIKTEKSITLLSYGKSKIRIKKTIKEKDLIFELYPKTCQQFFIGLTNLFILANKAQWIKISIANTTKEPVYILEDTIIEYLKIELENTSTPQKILNFPEIALYCELSSINWQQLLEWYQFMPEELAKLNIETMDPDQQQQLKALILKYSDIFSRNSKFGRIDLV
ncbi:hypothetical protein G9A89_016857 [Geosiphon pyriformis]|nr:hypothetical protein G9A89_016857 [Geosiphon pyriformis]